MSAQIIEFKTGHRSPPCAADNRSAFAKNERLRRARRDAWYRAGALSRYWQANLDFCDAVSSAHRHDLKDARGHAKTSIEDRWVILETYREAIGKHLLTPAPDMAAVTWKRRQLSHAAYLAVKTERVERSIADDIAFLEAHPTRNSRANRLRKGETRS